MVKVIKEGNKHEQGTHVCPQCGERVVIDRHFGDPPKCGCCRVPYRPVTNVTHWE